MFKVALVRELKLRARRPGDLIYMLGFFSLILFLYGMVFDHLSHVADSDELAIPVLWIGLLLASASSLGGLWKESVEWGVIEQCLLSPRWGCSGIWAHMIADVLWLGLPLLVIAAALTGVWFPVSLDVLMVNLLALALALPSVLWIGAFASALTVSLPRSGLLVAVLVLPLYVPILLLGCGINRLMTFDFSIVGPFSLLGALLLFICLIMPSLIFLALKWGA